MNKDKHYILQVDEHGQRRLLIQHRLYEASSQQFLMDAGLKPGMQVLEVGCGTGLMTTWIAQQVLPRGQVTAIDISPEQITTAKEHAANENINNVDFKVHDIYDTESLGQQFDLIYCSMVLHHLEKPKEAIAVMKNCLKHKGILVCEEPPGPEGKLCYPPSKAIQSAIELVAACFKQRNCHYEIAYEMTNVFRDLGFTDIKNNLFQPLLNTKEERLIFSMGIQELSSNIVKFGLLSKEEVDRLIKDLAALANTDACLAWIRMFQVSGSSASRFDI